MKRILCFGDSNTFGFRGDNSHRFPADIRWPGRLAHLLGEGYTVIEDGHAGRTIGKYDHHWPELSGVSVLERHLKKHAPVDQLVILLGTNDAFHSYAERITRDLRDLLYIAMNSLSAEDILLLAPSPVKHWVDPRHVCETLPAPFAALAAEFGIPFADTGLWQAELGYDGCHFSEKGHLRFAEMVLPYVK